MRMRRLWFTSIQDLSLLAVIDNGHMVVIYEDDHHSWQFRNHKAITGIYIWKCFVVVKLLSFHRKPNRLATERNIWESNEIQIANWPFPGTRPVWKFHFIVRFTFVLPCVNYVPFKTNKFEYFQRQLWNLKGILRVLQEEKDTDVWIQNK